MLALSVAAAVLAIAGLVLNTLTGSAAAAQRQQTGATQAARQTAVNLVTVDYRQADADIKRLLASGTGDFTKQFTNNSDSYSDVVKQNKVVSTGQVVDAGVADSSPGQVRVLVAVHSEVSNLATPRPQSRDYRIALTMQQIHGDWLASEVDFIP